MPLDAVDALSELDSETLLWFTENSWVLTKKHCFDASSWTKFWNGCPKSTTWVQSLTGTIPCVVFPMNPTPRLGHVKRKPCRPGKHKYAQVARVIFHLLNKLNLILVAGWPTAKIWGIYGWMPFPISSALVSTTEGLDSTADSVGHLTAVSSFWKCCDIDYM